MLLPQLRPYLLCFLLFLLIYTTGHAQRELWGTSMTGGDYGNGFIFRTDSIGDNLQIVHHFQTVVDGENISALTLASNDKLYGVAASGGPGTTGVYSGGTLFEYDPTTNQFQVLVTFTPDLNQLPYNPTTPRAEGKPVLTEIRPGVLYGLLRQGSYVFSYNINTGQLTQPFNVPTYNGDAMNSTLQNKLNTGFYKLGNYWYTTTPTNSECPIGNPYSGSVMRMDANGNGISVIFRAHCLASDGVSFDGTFAEANGKFYGTTAYGGSANSGVIYEYNPAISTSLAYTKLYDFVGYPYSYQVQSLVSMGNGKLYGAAHGGGDPEQNSPAGVGILFEFDIASRTYTRKYNFTLVGQSIYDLGGFPSGLIKGTNNKLYGATQYGVFEYNPANGAMRTAGRFNGLGFAPSLVALCRKPAYIPREQANFHACDGQPFSLDLGSTNTTTAVWTHDGVVDETQTSTILQLQPFTMAHNGNWVCTMTNACGTTVSQDFSLEYSTPNKPSITADGPLEFCAGKSVTLSASEEMGDCRWSTGATTQQITVTEGGNYSVLSDNGCESPVSDPVTVTVHALPAAPTLMVDEGGTTLTASGGSGIYLWMLDDIPLETAAATVTATVSGNYKVYSLSEENCVSTDFASRDIIVPVVTGIGEASDQTLKVYPNPSRGVFQIRVDNALRGAASMSVVNAQGDVVHTQALTLSKEPITLSLEHLPAGLYNLVIHTGAVVEARKIVIR